VLHLSQFSGGATSWKVTKDLVELNGPEKVKALFTDTLIEDEDLYRFNRESIDKLGIELITIADGRTPWEVFKDARWIGNSQVAQCSHELKQKMAINYVKENYKPDEVILYFGIDWTEIHRVKNIVKHWSPYKCEFPLVEQSLTKQDIFDEMERDGIRKPRLYDMGFTHNNCGGFCVRAGKGHFINLLKQKRELFLHHENEEQKMRDFLGRNDVSILSNQVFSHYALEERFGEMERVAKYKKIPLTLKELREEWENGLGMQIEMDDIGGCGCFTNYDEPAAVNI
jgi:3'-phosphoadenosine 5'-phosphosulfate sulfotransferase (PAPS reductase)/FAD synthetase